MLPSNVGNYAHIERVDTFDEDLGVLYEKDGEEYRHVVADYFKTVAIRSRTTGIIGLHEVHGTVDTGMWLKIT